MAFNLKDDGLAKKSKTSGFRATPLGLTAHNNLQFLNSCKKDFLHGCQLYNTIQGNLQEHQRRITNGLKRVSSSYTSNPSCRFKKPTTL